MKTGPLFLLVARVALSASAAFTAAPALAGDKAACLDAASKAQTFRDLHKLVEAREKLRVCAAAQCPAVVQSDCATWLAEVEQGLPTVVISATDGAGRDRFDVKVTVDGQAPAFTLQGQALPMNPGPHALHLETADGAALDQEVLVKEGMKNQSVAVVVLRHGDAAPVPPASTSPPADADRADGKSASPWRTVGWVTAGVGVAGLAFGAAFGLKAISDKNGAHCDASGACDPGPLGDANTSATISTVGIVAGGVLLAAGAALVLLSPRRDASPSALRLEVAPRIGTRDGGLVLGGTW